MPTLYIIQIYLTSRDIAVSSTARWRRGWGVQVKQRYRLISPVCRYGDAASAAALIRCVGSFQHGSKQHQPLVPRYLSPVYVTRNHARNKKDQKNHKGTGSECDVACLLTSHRSSFMNDYL